MQYIDPCCFEFLLTAKRIYDCGLMDKVADNFGNMEICDDYYSIAWEGIACAFDGLRHFYKEDTEVETLVFTDSVITEFYRLCRLYERWYGLEKKDNSFRKDCESEIYQCLQLDSYDYDVRLYDGAHGVCRMVVLTGVEFYSHTELPSALTDAKLTFETYCKKLKQKLVIENAGAETPQNTEQEAA